MDSSTGERRVVSAVAERGSRPPVAGEDIRRYLDLLQRSVTGYLALGGAEPFSAFRALDGVRYRDFTWDLTEQLIPRTLLTEPQLDNFEQAIRTVVAEGVEGDILEAGVWRGGACIYARGVLAALGVEDRTVWAADSFAGIPASGTADRPEPVDDWLDRWVTPREDVEAAFERYGLLDEQMQFIEGPFAQSLSAPSPAKLSVIRLDADTYTSTTQALDALYPRLSPGGFVIIDDWHVPSARSAVLDYRQRHGIAGPLQPVLGPDDDMTLYEMQWRSEHR